MKPVIMEKIARKMQEKTNNVVHGEMANGKAVDESVEIENGKQPQICKARNGNNAPERSDEEILDC